MPSSVWFITGASRGFGLEITKAALAAGHRVVATARDPEAVRKAFPDASTDQLLAVALDVTDPRQADQAVRQALAAFQRIDVLVNNAGYGLFGALEETSDAEIRALFDTNVFGLLTVTRAVLPTFRAQHSGHVVNLSSVAGIATGAGFGNYAASKFAVEGITEALAAELAPFGAKATAIEPGSFRTDFLDASSHRRAATGLDAYADTVHRALTALGARSGNQPGDPARAAAAVLEVVASPDPPVRLALGPDSYTRILGKLESASAELEAWRELSLSTDFAVS